MNERRTEIEGVLRHALSLPVGERTGYLDQACLEAAVRSEVERRLAREEEATLLPERAGSSPVEEGGNGTGVRAGVARRLGKYTILEVLGEGGMGVVYLAEQDSPRRRIALKVVRPGLLTPRMLRRFEHESQILGRLQHPGIAQVYEAGTADTGAGPQPYFAMEYVKGVALTDHAEAAGLGARARLELMVRVCEAVHHAHQKGVIHRDLKPGNVLVDEGGRVKVLDFGVARATDAEEGGGSGGQTFRTEAGAMVGTLAYMSPEQLSGDPHAVDTRSDVYALGVVMYELLAGRVPISVDKRTIPEAVRALSEQEAVPLGNVVREFRGDVQTIVAKSMEKDRQRRYQSASELAADIGRYLRDEPIAARPPSVVYQVRKFSLRHKAVVVGVLGVFVALVGGIVGVAWQARRAGEEAAIARQVSAVMDGMLRAVNPEEAQGREPTLRELLDSAAVGLERGEKLNPRVELALRETIGRTYHSLGRLAEAERQYEGVLRLAAAGYGEWSRPALQARRNLVSVWADMGEFEKAEKEALRVVEMAGKRLGEDDAETIFAKMDLGRVYQETGRWDEAEPLLKGAMEAGRDKVGEEDQRFITALHNMGTAIKDAGRVEESVGLLREALRLRRKTLGADHPDTLYSMNNLGAALQRWNQEGAHEEAERLMRETLEARTRVLGADHVSTITTAGNLAVALVESKQLEEALPLAERAYEGWKRSLGEAHPKTLMGMGNLGYLYEDLGRDVEAEAMYRRVVEVRKRGLGGQDPETWSPMNNLAMLLARTGKLEEAEGQYRELLGLCAQRLPADHAYVGIFRNNFGECLTRAGKFVEAEKELLESLPILETKLGAGNARWVKGVERLAAMYEAKGDAGRAAEWRGRLAGK